MNSTINSNCCNRTLYIFKDNLVNYPFWIYGNITYSQYISQLQNRSNGSKIATCPSTLPFVNATTNVCFVCPSHLPIYNLTSGTCFAGCHSLGLILNLTTHQCGFNTTCALGMYWNSQTLKC